MHSILPTHYCEPETYLRPHGLLHDPNWRVRARIRRLVGRGHRTQHPACSIPASRAGGNPGVRVKPRLAPNPDTPCHTYIGLFWRSMGRQSYGSPRLVVSGIHVLRHRMADVSRARWTINVLVIAWPCSSWQHKEDLTPGRKHCTRSLGPFGWVAPLGRHHPSQLTQTRIDPDWLALWVRV